MSRFKATVSFIHARRHPDELAREVEAELRFHIETRTHANIEGGMKLDEARVAALKSFGDFDRVKASCCEIRRSLPFDSTPLRIGLNITVLGLAVLAGGAAYWTVNGPHNNLISVLRQLFAIAVLACLFVFVRRARSRYRPAGDRASGVFITEGEGSRKNELFANDVSREGSVNIASHDEEGLTPVERMFKSERLK
jgi:hypothetical protein